jgi:hypothetical protein
VLNQESPNMGQSMNISDSMQPMPTNAMRYQLIYPEMYYRLHPYIMMVCDEMDMYGAIPTQEMVMQITDSIYDDVCRMYPDMAKYVGAYAVKATIGDPPEFGDRIDRDRGDFGGRFRRRGPFRDIIDILLLSELFNRRRDRY